MAEGNTPTTTTTQNPPTGEKVNQQVIDGLTDKSGPKPGDFVKVGDKLYTAKDIESVLAAQAKLEGDVKAARDENVKWVDRAKKVYGNPENPDRTALKEYLMAAGKTADQADAMIAEEFPEADQPATKGKEDKQPEQRDDWTSRAWLQTEFDKAAVEAFKTNESLQTYVKARAMLESDPKAKAEATEFVAGEIQSNIAIRAKRILERRVGQEGVKAFQAAPVRWFGEAMKQAAEEESNTARKRYGDPNKLGPSAGASAPDPISEFLAANKPKSTFSKYDPSKTTEEAGSSFADRLAFAVMEEHQKSKTAGV